MDDLKNNHPLPRLEFRERYGGISVNIPAVNINPDDVPINLQPLIPLAEKWGIKEDSWVPQDVVRTVPKAELEELVETVGPFITNNESDLFDIWLAGPEVNGPTWTIAYLAFTELRIVFEDAEWVLENWDEIHS